MQWQGLIRTFLLLCNLAAAGQSVSTIMGARSGAMGNISTLQDSEWSAFNNIGGLTNLGTTAGFSYEVRPSLTSANRLAAFVTCPTSIGIFSTGTFRFGDDIYNEQLINLGFSSSIGHTTLGIRAAYIQYRAEGFGTHGTIGVDFGGITKITENVFIGAWVQNLNQPKLKFNDSERAPVKLYLSLGVRPTDKFSIISEIEKDILYPILWKFGMEYIILKKFYLRSGLNLTPNSYFAGVGFKSWKIKIDYSLQSFSRLSASHQASASIQIFSLKEKK